MIKRISFLFYNYTYSFRKRPADFPKPKCLFLFDDTTLLFFSFSFFFPLMGGRASFQYQFLLRVPTSTTLHFLLPPSPSLSWVRLIEGRALFFTIFSLFGAIFFFSFYFSMKGVVSLV